MKKVIVAGSRTFGNFTLLEKELMAYFKEHNLHRADVEIISGTANGADKLGEKFAEKYGLKLTRFPADWDKYGKSAGYIRNEEMAKYASEDGVLFAFWNTNSPGTKHMIDIARKNHLSINVVSF
jgi:hypothetical protein